MSDKTFTFQDLINFANELDKCPGGSSYLDYGDIQYRTDMGYAFEGIYMFLDALSRKYGLEELLERADCLRMTRPRIYKE